MNTTLKGDAAELPIASYWPDIYEEIDRGEITLEEAFIKYQHLFQPLINAQATTFATWILDTIEKAPSAAIGVVAVNILLNRSPYTEISLGKWARRLGTTKKTISQFLVTQRDNLKLKPSGIAKSSNARIEFSKAQRFYNEKARQNNVNGNGKHRDNFFDFTSYTANRPLEKTPSGDQEAASEMQRLGPDCN
jgi:hypothetical protein